MKLFSIVVVSLNTKNQFLRTINSIKKQKFKNYELIIVDGDSFDGTKEEIQKIKLKSKKCIIGRDKGIYDAMNKGIKKCSGKWIIFLNSGDVFYNQHVLEKVSKKKIQNFDILYGDTNVKHRIFNYKISAKKFTKQTIIMPFCHQSCFVKRKLLLKRSFSLNYKIASDFDFFNYSFKKKKSFLNLNLQVSKIIAGGLSDISRDQVYCENLRIIKKYNNNHILILKLYLYRLFNFFKNIVKFLLPDTLILLLMNIKYNNKITLK